MGQLYFLKSLFNRVCEICVDRIFIEKPDAHGENNESSHGNKSDKPFVPFCASPADVEKPLDVINIGFKAVVAAVQSVAPGEEEDCCFGEPIPI